MPSRSSELDPSQDERHTVLKIFQGLALAVVNKILKADEPDFVIKTQTAIMGVRGTEIGIRIQPNSSTILNFQGRTQVGNILPQVSRLFLKAFKVAYNWAPRGDYPGSSVFLEDMQGTVVGQHQPPTLPFVITPQDQSHFMRQLTTYALSGQHHTPGTPVTQTGSNLPVGLHLPGSQNTVDNLTTISVPPKVVPQVQAPPPAPPAPEPTHQSSPGFSITSPP